MVSDILRPAFKVGNGITDRIQHFSDSISSGNAKSYQDYADATTPALPPVQLQEVFQGCRCWPDIMYWLYCGLATGIGKSEVAVVGQRNAGFTASVTAEIGQQRECCRCRCDTLAPLPSSRN